MRFNNDDECRTLPELLHRRAELHPERTAAIFVDDLGIESALTYGQLWAQTLRVAAALTARRQVDESKSQSPIDAPRALLLFAPGLDFLPAFFGAQVAGWIPVPTCHPRPNRELPRVDSVTRDCQPEVILSTKAVIAGVDRSKLAALTATVPMVAVDDLPNQLEMVGASALHWTDNVSSDSIALLQYTSGSTSDPKGVIVTQRNVIANLKAIITGFHIPLCNSPGNDAPTAVSWLPFFHDMGLIGGVLAPLFLGYRSVYISPQSFIQRPIRWLRMIHQYGAIVSGAPNFAYDLCADRIAPEQAASLDLSHWQLAFCGAEPIRPQSLLTFAHRFGSIGFRADSFYPCYGLAEATLLASGGQGPAALKVIDVDRAAMRQRQVEIATQQPRRDVNSLVSCGTAAVGTTIKIVDPETRQEVANDTIGEIWLCGASITSGYWNRPEENELRFTTLMAAKSVVPPRWFRRAAQASTIPSQDSTQRYLRTGDLGFVHDGRLYVAGRIKDVVIVRGRNYAPQDIEQTVRCSGDVVLAACAAFSVDGPRAEGLGVVAEIARDTSEDKFASIVRDIRRAVIDEHEIDPRLVVLSRPGTVPMTSSGKVQRAACRAAVLADEISRRYRWERSGGAESPPLPIPALPQNLGGDDRARVESLVSDWLGSWLIARVGIDPVDIEAGRRFDDYGLDSLTAVELSGELEDWSGVELTPTNAWEHPTIATMAAMVAAELTHTDETLVEQSPVRVGV